MVNKTFFILFFLIGGIIFQNCTDDDCSFAPVPDFFDIQDVEIEHLDSERRTIDSIDVLFSDYGFLNLNFIVEYIVQHQTKQRTFSLINSAYGCTPINPGALGSKEESIELLQIVTVNDYNENHQSGESINDILTIENLEIGQTLLSDFLNEFDKNVPEEQFMFRLLEEPTSSQTFQVRVILNLSTGEEFEVLSPIINFL